MAYSQGWFYKQDIKRRRENAAEINDVEKEVAAVYHAVDPTVVGEITAPVRKHLEGRWAKDIPRTNALTYEAPKQLEGSQGAKGGAATAGEGEGGDAAAAAGQIVPADGRRASRAKPNYRAAAAKVLGAHLKARSLDRVD